MDLRTGTERVVGTGEGTSFVSNPLLPLSTLCCLLHLELELIS